MSISGQELGFLLSGSLTLKAIEGGIHNRCEYKLEVEQNTSSPELGKSILRLTLPNIPRDDEYPAPPVKIGVLFELFKEGKTSLVEAFFSLTELIPVGKNRTYIYRGSKMSVTNVCGEADLHKYEDSNLVEENKKLDKGQT